MAKSSRPFTGSVGWTPSKQTSSLNSCLGLEWMMTRRQKNSPSLSIRHATLKTLGTSYLEPALHWRARDLIPRFISHLYMNIYIYIYFSSRREVFQGVFMSREGFCGRRLGVGCGVLDVGLQRRWCWECHWRLLYSSQVMINDRT
jgi:hypothetical protein